MSFFTDDIVKQQRIKTCESCDRFNKKIRTCKECGCLMDLKINLKRSKCPKNYWNE